MKPAIGAHVSAAGGLDKLIERADELGVEAVQLHPSAPQSYRGPSYDDDSIASWRAAIEKRAWPVFFHGIYLINLASEDERLWHASIGSVNSYLDWSNKLQAVGTITHVGSHKGRGLDAVEERLKKAAVKLTSSGKGRFIIENTAGGGGTLGRDIEELARLFKIFSAHVPTGLCIDSCHLFASGVDIRNSQILSDWLSDFDDKIGLDNLVAIHFNDSVFDCGSNRDRHANLGQGLIGADALAALLNEPRLKNVPFLLEVPGAGKGPDLENISLAQSWRN